MIRYDVNALMKQVLLLPGLSFYDLQFDVIHVSPDLSGILSITVGPTWKHLP